MEDPNPNLPLSDLIFPAKEATRYSSSYSHYEVAPLTTFECPMYPNSGQNVIIWPWASHPLHSIVQTVFKQGPSDLKKFPFPKKQVIQDMIDWLYIDTGSSFSCVGFLKGWNKEWGCSHSRIAKLLDRDYVWVATQTMVSSENFALWAKHEMLTYKVYPGFWGRLQNTTHCERGLEIRTCPDAAFNSLPPLSRLFTEVIDFILKVVHHSYILSVSVSRLILSLFIAPRSFFIAGYTPVLVLPNV